MAKNQRRQERNSNLVFLGMQVQIRTNLLEFEFALNVREFQDPSKFEFATSNLYSPFIRLNSPQAKNP